MTEILLQQLTEVESKQIFSIKRITRDKLFAFQRTFTIKWHLNCSTNIWPPYCLNIPISSFPPPDQNKTKNRTKKKNLRRLKTRIEAINYKQLNCK